MVESKEKQLKKEDDQKIIKDQILIDQKNEPKNDVKKILKIDSKKDQKTENEVESINHPRMTELRNKVLDYLKDNEKEFHPDDIELLKTNNFWINRFLNFNGQSFESAFDHLIETFRYRKESGIRSIDRSSFPLEFYMSSTAFIYLPDKEGRPILYIRVKKLVPMNSDLTNLAKQYIHLLIDEIDKLGNKEHGFNLFFDLCGSGWKNLDLDILHYLIQTTRHRYPTGCKWSFIYGLPWFLNLVVKNILIALPSETIRKVKFVSGSHYDELPLDAVYSNFTKLPKDLNSNNKLLEKKEDAETKIELPIEEFIDRSNLPDFLGGTSKLNYKIAPKNAVSIKKKCTNLFNYTEKETEKAIKPLQSIIDDVSKTYKFYKDNNFDFEFDLDEISGAYAKHIKL